VSRPAALTLAAGGIGLTLDGRTGGVVALRDDTLGTLVSDARGGSLFVLEVPRHGDRTVVVETRDQTLTNAEAAADGRSVRLRWDTPVTSTGERLDGFIQARIALGDAGRVDLALDYELTDAPVEAARFPSLRGIRPQNGGARRGTLEWRGVDYSTGTRVPLLPVFENNSPYWGTTFPDYASTNLRPEVMCNPTSPFVLLAGEPGGLAVMPAEPTLEFIGWRASLEPGYQDSMLRTTAPSGEAAGADDAGADDAGTDDAGAAGVPAGVTFDAIQMPAAADGPTSLVPMTVHVYRGAWTAGLDRYRPGQRPTRISRASWLDEPRSWLQVQVMSTEGEPRYDFDDLLGILDECAEAGIGAIQIVGWNEGGQDGLVPVHRPAEKLGGEAGLRRVLDRARELDVQAVLYVKYQWVEKPGPSWDELEPYVCLDVNGQPYAQPGPVYHSSRKRYGVSTPWYVPLCFAAPELRARFAAEVGELAEWGAAGVLADESLYHGRALLCFAENHGHAPGASTYLWDGDFVEDLRRATGDRADEFVIAGEGCYDAQFEHYDLSYFRSFSPRHVPVGRMLRPEGRIVTALTGFDDRSMVNQSLAYGYAMSFEPFNFKGRPGDMPRTVEYGVAVDALRARLADWLWHGRLIDIGDGDSGVRVEWVDASAAGLSAVWATDRAAGRAVVLANTAETPALVRVSGLVGPVSEWTPEAPEGRSSPGGEFELAARSVVVLLEASALGSATSRAAAS
jgi:hypothetical protein